MNDLLGEVKHVTTRPYHPQSNGAAERNNRTIEGYITLVSTEDDFKTLRFRILDTLVNAEGDDWDLKIHEVLVQLRIKPRRATGFSPFDLFHTWKFRMSPGEIEHEEDAFIKKLENGDPMIDQQMDDACVEMAARFAGIRELLKDEVELNLTKERSRQKKSFDVRHLERGEAVSVGMIERIKGK